MVVVLDHAVEGDVGQGRACQRLPGGAHLAPAAVHQEQVRFLAEIVIAGLPGLGQSGVFFVLRRPPGDGLRQRGVVVGAQHGFHLELTVARLIGLAVLERDHTADTGAIAPVGNIVALNGAGRLCKAQHLGQLVQQLFFPGIAAALPGQTLHCIGVGHLDKTGLIAPLGNVELHLAPPLLVQSLLQDVGVRRQLVHRDDLGDLLVVQIVPGQKLLPRGGDIRRIVEKELPLIRQPSLPEAEHRRADAAGGARQCHHVHLHIRVHHHFLARRHFGDGVDLVADQGRCLKFQPVGGFHHPLVEGFQDVFFAVPDQVDRAPDRLIVIFTADLAAAHGHAFADMGVQAGAAPADLLREALVAPGQQKGVHGRFCHLPGRKAGSIGAQILRAVVLFLEHEREPGPLLFGDLNIAVALIVLEQDVVFGGVGLDLAGFQHQRLKLTLADDNVERIGVGDHLADLVVVGHTLPEILADPDAEPLGLADIDDGIGFIPDNINTG